MNVSQIYLSYETRSKCHKRRNLHLYKIFCDDKLYTSDRRRAVEGTSAVQFEGTGEDARRHYSLKALVKMQIKDGTEQLNRAASAAIKCARTHKKFKPLQCWKYLDRFLPTAVPECTYVGYGNVLSDLNSHLWAYHAKSEQTGSLSTTLYSPWRVSCMSTQQVEQPSNLFSSITIPREEIYTVIVMKY